MKKKKIRFKYEFVLYFVIFCLISISLFVKNSKTQFDIADANAEISDQTINMGKVTVILDAGHGGEDCGAVSENGVLEKELNMLMCIQIRDILSLYGINTVLTRTEDKLLYTEQQNIKGQRKIYDLKNRYLIASEYENAIFVSIHMNKFHESKYKGLQVYYSQNNEKSRGLASDIQSLVKCYIQNDNNREIKNASSAIYLLDRLECTAVLVECGFLSNKEETELLCDAEYRQQLAFLISEAIIKNIDV